MRTCSARASTFGHVTLIGVTLGLLGALLGANLGLARSTTPGPADRTEFARLAGDYQHLLHAGLSGADLPASGSFAGAVARAYPDMRIQRPR